MHEGSQPEPVLAAWGITRDGKPVFVDLDPWLVWAVLDRASRDWRVHHDPGRTTAAT
jgi:hypothetical protein